jgi:uroporphyrinogen III methyltransferase / synthase
MSSGPTVVLTREVSDNAPLVELLEARGIPVREVPCLRTRFLSPSPEQVQCLPSAAENPILVFTSRRGVEGFFRSEPLCAWFEGAATRHLSPRVRVAAVGPATGEALRQRGVTPWIVVEPPHAAALAGKLVHSLSPDVPVVFVRGNLSMEILSENLRQAHFRVFPLQVYENCEPAIPALQPFSVLAVVVYSPSAARRLLAINPWMRSARFVVPGMTTERAVREMGVEVILVIRSELEAMLTCLEQLWQGWRGVAGSQPSLEVSRP